MDNVTNNYFIFEAKTILAIIAYAIIGLVFYREIRKKKNKTLLSTKKTSDALGLKIKGKGKLENIYNGKKIKIARHYLGLGNDYTESYGSFGMLTFDNRKSYVTRIETDVDNNIFKPSLIPKPFFILKRKGASNAKWIYFENSLDLKNKFNLRLSSKIKSKIEQLFVGGYFRGPTGLKIFPPDRAILPQRVKIVFDLLPKIMQDKDSLEIAMDVVVDMAKQIDEMKTAKRN